MLQKILQIRGFNSPIVTFEEIKESIDQCLIVFISHDHWQSMPKDQKKVLTERPLVLIHTKPLSIATLRQDQLAGFLRVPFENEALFAIADDLQYRFGENKPERSTIRYPLEKQCKLLFKEKVKISETRAIVQDIASGGFKAAITLEPGKSVEDLPPEGMLELPDGDQILKRAFTIRWSKRERFFMTIGCQWVEQSDEFTDQLLEIIAAESHLFFLNL